MGRERRPNKGRDAAPPRSQNDILEGRSFAHTMRSVNATNLR